MRNHALNTKGPRVAVSRAGNVLGDYPRQFRTYLESHYYTPETLAGYLRAISAIEPVMRAHGLAVGDLDEDEAVRLFSKVEWPEYKRQHGNYMVRNFVRFLVKQGAKTPEDKPAPVKSTRDKLRQDYEAYLRNERGLSEGTIKNLWSLIARFLKFRFGDKVEVLSKITQVDIASFMQKLHSREQPYRVKTTATHLRWFSEFLFWSGKTKINLSLGIPSVAQRFGQRLPRHLLPEQVEAILAAVRSDTPLGRRNYAMILLLARLGLRPPEVIAMQLDDIDWRAGEIIVRGKGKLHDRIPLPQEVGEALAAYIQLGRVTISRALFVSDRAPHLGFKCNETLNGILKDAFAKTGIKKPTRYVGAHILRHSLATNLVQRGASLDEVANVMRHRSRATTLAYAKLDIEGLRSVALPWPVKGGAK